MVALLMAGCSEAEIDNGQQQKGLMPVLFSAGNTDIALTRGESAAYMPKESRFVCSMFFHAGADDKDEDPFYTDQPAEDVNMVTTWLKINNTTGNAVYWKYRQKRTAGGDPSGTYHMGPYRFPSVWRGRSESITVVMELFLIDWC